MNTDTVPEPKSNKSVIILNKDDEKIEMPVNEFLDVIKDIPVGGQKHG